jgi:hypothetical protein
MHERETSDLLLDGERNVLQYYLLTWQIAWGEGYQGHRWSSAASREGIQRVPCRWDAEPGTPACTQTQPSAVWQGRHCWLPRSAREDTPEGRRRRAGETMATAFRSALFSLARFVKQLWVYEWGWLEGVRDKAGWRSSANHLFCKMWQLNCMVGLTPMVPFALELSQVVSGIARTIVEIVALLLRLVDVLTWWLV